MITVRYGSNYLALFEARLSMSSYLHRCFYVVKLMEDLGNECSCFNLRDDTRNCDHREKLQHCLVNHHHSCSNMKSVVRSTFVSRNYPVRFPSANCCHCANCTASSRSSFPARSCYPCFLPSIFIVSCAPLSSFPLMLSFSHHYSS